MLSCSLYRMRGPRSEAPSTAPRAWGRSEPGCQGRAAGHVVRGALGACSAALLRGLRGVGRLRFDAPPAALRTCCCR